MTPEYKEIGTLRSLSEGQSQFIGSSSGIYFVNTVRRTFAAVAASSAGPSPEDCIIDAAEPMNKDSNVSSAYISGATPAPMIEKDPTSYRLSVACDIGTPPSSELARELMMIYFRVWHPIFPFLHGPTFLRDLEIFYSARESSSSLEPAAISRAVTLQCVFNISTLHRPDLRLSASSRIRSPDHILPLLGILALKCDTASIQALLAAQLYLIAIMSLRAASSVGGLVWRSILKAGLHRCPYRYSHLLSHDRDIRKRIFWSAYTIDRFLSQALGHTLGIQDSDFDVCLPGTHDLHDQEEPLDSPNLGNSPGDTSSHIGASQSNGTERYPSCNPNASEDSVADDGVQEDDAETRYALQRRRDRQSVLPYYAEYSKLTGRALEMFHKSIHVRSTDQAAILCLKADIDSWWNDLPTFLQEYNTGDSTQQYPLEDGMTGGTANWGAFFTIEYHQLILLTKRPSLSLDPSTPEFRSALQTCIVAARTIINALETLSTYGHAPFWPGFLSGAWMSGLIIVFACQLNLYTHSKGLSETSACLKVLEVMTQRWPMAKHCYQVLSSLVENLPQKSSKRVPELVHSHTNRNSRQGYSGAAENHITASRSIARDHNERPPAKRRRSNVAMERHQSQVGSYAAVATDRSPSLRQVLDQEEPHSNFSPQTSIHHINDAYKHGAINTTTDDFMARSETRQLGHSQWIAENPAQIGSASSLSSVYVDLNTEDDGLADHLGGPNNWRQKGLLTPLGFSDPSGYDIFSGATWESLIDIMDGQDY